MDEQNTKYLKALINFGKKNPNNGAIYRMIMGQVMNPELFAPKQEENFDEQFKEVGSMLNLALDSGDQGMVDRYKGLADELYKKKYGIETPVVDEAQQAKDAVADLESEAYLSKLSSKFDITDPTGADFLRNSQILTQAQQDPSLSKAYFQNLDKNSLGSRFKDAPNKWMSFFAKPKSNDEILKSAGFNL